MKRIMFSKVTLAFVSILCLGSSCSSGDGDTGSPNSNIPNSRSLKISKMMLDEIYNYYDDTYRKIRDTLIYNEKYAPFVIGADYDELGRLTKVFATEPFLRKGKTVNYKTIATIDYDLKIIETLKWFNPSYSNKNNNTLQFDFKLNDKECFSRISDASFIYNSEGYLISAKRAPTWKFSLSYNDNNIVSSVLERLLDIVNNYSCNYSNDVKSGELMMSVTYPEENFNITPGKIVCLIAYMSGMFGNTTRFFNQLSRYEENSAKIKLLDDNSDYWMGLHFNFEYE